MLNKQNIICISSIDWDFVWQGHQEIMSAFAGAGNRVLFIENTGVRPPGIRDMSRLHKRLVNWIKSVKGFRKEAENLFVYSPLVLPFPYSRLARWVNKYLLISPLKRWMKAVEFRDPIVWTFLPTGTALDIMNSLDCKLAVYYCIADFSKLADPKKVERAEKKLLQRCDVVFAQGGVLSQKCSRHNSNVHIFPFGVRMSDFESFISKTPDDLKDIKGPIIGYVGGVHRHLDMRLLEQIALARPDWSMVFVGPVQTDISRLSRLKNVYFLGKKEFSQLPQYISKFNACLVPYLRSGYTETVYPTKLNEYHALGKPVISTELPEVINFNSRNKDLVSVAATAEGFIEKISEALREPVDGALAVRRISSAKKNDWPRRINEMGGIMEKALEQKSVIPADWTERFTKAYKAAGRRLLKLAAVAAAGYFLLFYTPLVRNIAEPLKISQAPRKADCIVVFAGGVGESGKAGQGYEERVSRAVELYKAGYADTVLFSSGYKYFLDEVTVMKALAVSLGVPESAILTEDDAKNTFENVKFTKEILENQGMDSVLLVSSPYHMRRAMLVFNKLCPDIKVTCTPVNDSVFYAFDAEKRRGNFFAKKASAAQVRGIMHEYMGILYYRWKGYI